MSNRSRNPGEKGRRSAGHFELMKLQPDQAIAVLRPAAEADNAQAAYMLSVVYEGGAGLPRDTAQAARWFARAVELDPEHVTAQLTERCHQLLQVILQHGASIAGRDSVDAQARGDADQIRESVQQLRTALEHLSELASAATSPERDQRSA